MDLVSIIIPCFNQARFVSEAIESVLAQSYPRYELVVVDDGSSDGSADIIRRYPDLRYVYQPNQGLSAARNRGLEVVRGRYVVFLDADDRLDPHHLSISMETIRRAPEAAAVFGDYRLLGSTAGHTHDCAPRPDTYGTLLRGNIIPCPAVAAVRRDIVAAVGGFRRQLRSAEDYDLFLRIAAHYPMVCHHRVVAEYRQHEGQMSRRWHVMLTASMQVLRMQSPYVRANPQYREAHRAGIRHVQQRYGEPLLWQTTDALRLRRWHEAFACLRVLVRDYPTGMVAHVGRKIRRAVQRPGSIPAAG
ncbi:glycosyltransferase [Candidatus Nitrospira bockiana]